MSTLAENIGALKQVIKEQIAKGVSYENKKSISYTQYSMYQKCPKSWELAYAKKLRTYTPSIHTVFGTSLHETLQHYLTLLFDHSVKEADALDLNLHLKQRLMFNYAKELKAVDGKHFSTPEDLLAFWEDGCAILQWLKRRRVAYFSTKDHVLLGIEVPIHMLADPSVNLNIYLVAYLDLVIYDKIFNRIRIFDIKTSTRGWTDKEKKDPEKIAQVMLYKHYFSKKYNLPLENIEVEFFIVKRKVFENAAFPVKRVQNFIPAQGKVSINKATSKLNSFVSHAFNQDGSYNLNNEYHAISGEKHINCKYCEFKDNDELCPANKRLKTAPFKIGDD